MTTAIRSRPPVLTDPVTDYARAVVAGQIVAGGWVIKACARHLRDIEHGHERGLTFDLGEAAKATHFFTFLRHYKGEWAGQPLKLEPWQQFIIGSLFGWMRADGARRFRVAYVEVPRKNGKSLLAAGVGLLLAFFDGEGGAEVYAAATKRDQARIVWGDARSMVLSAPQLKQRVVARVGNLHQDATSSKFEPLGADLDGMDGLNIHGVIVDELHAHKTRGMWDVLQTATGARRQPLTFAITTAGFGRHSVCYEQHDYGFKILDQVFDDDTFFAYIAQADEGDDWSDPMSWKKANPNYGISVKVDDLDRKCAKAKQVPAEQNAFRRLHLDEWTEQETRWLDMDVFDANTDEPGDLVGEKCFVGMDLSNTTDLTAVELYFPESDSFLHFYFVPEERLRQRADRDRVPYPLWEEQGYLTATPGNVVDYDYIREKLNELREEGYEIQEVGYDPWNATGLVTDLMADGFVCVPIRQGFASLTAPTKDLEKLLLAKKAKLGKNPVTRWAASNVSVEQDAAGNIKPSKAKSTERIDPIVAMILALDRAGRHIEEPVRKGTVTIG